MKQGTAGNLFLWKFWSKVWLSIFFIIIIIVIIEEGFASLKLLK